MKSSEKKWLRDVEKALDFGGFPSADLFPGADLFPAPHQERAEQAFRLLCA